jgi:two-component system, sensor histidine kinase PdtaS
MENLLVLLPSRPQSVPVRYGVTTLIMLVCFALQIGVEFQSGMFTFFLLLPGIFLASVLFDRGSGFYATILSTALCYAVLSPSDSWLLPPQYRRRSCTRNDKRGDAKSTGKGRGR